MQAKEIIASVDSIHATYFVPLNVRKHMKQVAAVAHFMCDHCKDSVDTGSIVASCLIHDLGNIVKMDFVRPETIALLLPQDQKKLSFYRKKQEEFRTKYGMSDIHADILIAQELGVSKKIQQLIDHGAIKLVGEAFLSEDLEDMIASYADMRVAPSGVVSLLERAKEYETRYQYTGDPIKLAHSAKFTVLAHAMEKKLFTHIRLVPSDITDATILPYLEKY